MKQKTCSRCGKKYGVNSFDGGDVCARCISWEARRQALKRRYIKRYQEVTQLKHESDVRLQLAALEAIIENGTMAETARQLGVNRGNIHKAINGEDVPVLRRIFGIKQHLVEIEPCPHCGEVHKLKGCNRRKRRKVYKVAFSFRDEAEAEAFRQIVGTGAEREAWAKQVIETARACVRT
jgi:DNA-binding phage protein